MSRRTRTNKTIKNSQPETEKQKNSNKNQQLLFNLTANNVGILGQNIVDSVRNSVDFICYSHEAMIHPELSVTEIPGLTLLFVQACLQQGLLGYLDWKEENHPNEQNNMIMNNVIIATCGKRVPDETLDPENQAKGIAHDVDPDKLAFIRNKSRERFNELIASRQ